MKMKNKIENLFAEPLLKTTFKYVKKIIIVLLLFYTVMSLDVIHQRINDFDDRIALIEAQIDFIAQKMSNCEPNE